MKIIELAVRRRRLYWMRLDTGDAMAVDRATFDESPYALGGTITPEQLEALLEASQYHRAHERALYLLGLRDYACRELEKKLLTEATPAIAAAVVERLRAVGLLDDGQYAARLARHLSEDKQYPRRRVEQELRQRGIEAELAHATAQEIGEEDFQQALALLKKKYYNRMNTEDERRRVSAALARRGFSYTAIRRALEAFGASPESAD